MSALRAQLSRAHRERRARFQLAVTTFQQGRSLDELPKTTIAPQIGEQAPVIAEQIEADQAPVIPQIPTPQPHWFYTTPDGARTYPHVKAIQFVVADRYGMTVEELKSPKRKRPIVQARQLGYHLVQELTRKSTLEIGRRFGGRDHTTVMHGCRQVALRLQSEPAFAQLVDELRTLLTPPEPPLRARDENMAHNDGAEKQATIGAP
jgi:hypothetical protein